MVVAGRAVQSHSLHCDAVLISTRSCLSMRVLTKSSAIERAKSCVGSTRPTAQDLVEEWCDDVFPERALNVFLAVLMSPLSPSTCASATSASSRRLRARAVHFSALGPHQAVIYLELLFQMAILRYSASGLLKHNDHPPISVIISYFQPRLESATARAKQRRDEHNDRTLPACRRRRLLPLVIGWR